MITCKQPTNPNPPLTTAEQWAEYFRVGHLVEDQDLRQIHGWVYEYNSSGQLECVPVESDWMLINDPYITVHWEFVDDPPDLTVPGTYFLKAIFANDSIPDPILCNPCVCPDGTENCEACQECPARKKPTIRDPDIERLFTIIVPDCCGCSPPPECHGIPLSYWTFIEASDSCGPHDNWVGPPLVDDCGNRLQLVCTGAYYLLYNGSIVGTCTFTCGRNVWAYRKFQTDCGWQFHELFHRTIDTDAMWNTPPCCDRGTCGQFDWLDTHTLPCLVGPPAPPSCCAGIDYPGREPGAPCPSPGNCDNTVRCNGKCSTDP